MEGIERRIVQAARRLLQHGGSGFTMDRLAEQAGVPRATVYRRVGSKAALLQRLVSEHGVALDPQQDMRTRIVQAARRVIGRYGLLNATMEQVAAEAGVGVATVYRHFTDKDTLIRAVVDELSPRPFVRDLVQPSGDAAADLTALAAALLPALYEYRDIMRLLLTDNPDERAYIEHLRAGSSHTLDEMTRYFEAQIRSGAVRAAGPPRELALAFIGLLFAFAVIGPAHYGMALTEPEGVSSLIVQTFLSGVGCSPA